MLFNLFNEKHISLFAGPEPAFERGEHKKFVNRKRAFLELGQLRWINSKIRKNRFCLAGGFSDLTRLLVIYLVTSVQHYPSNTQNKYYWYILTRTNNSGLIISPTPPNNTNNYYEQKTTCFLAQARAKNVRFFYFLAFSHLMRSYMIQINSSKTKMCTYKSCKIGLPPPPVSFGLRTGLKSTLNEANENKTHI